MLSVHELLLSSPPRPRTSRSRRQKLPKRRRPRRNPRWVRSSHGAGREGAGETTHPPPHPGVCLQAKEKKGKAEKGKEKGRPKEKKGKGPRRVDKGLLAQRRLEERRRQQLILEEMKKPTEDMCLADHQVGMGRGSGGSEPAPPALTAPLRPAAAAHLLAHPRPGAAQPRLLPLPDGAGVPAELRQGAGIRPQQGRAQPEHAAGGAAGGGRQRRRRAGPAGAAAAGCALRPRAAPLLPGTAPPLCLSPALSPCAPIPCPDAFGAREAAAAAGLGWASSPFRDVLPTLQPHLGTPIPRLWVPSPCCPLPAASPPTPLCPRSP